jgi:hypothetical protein
LLSDILGLAISEGALVNMLDAELDPEFGTSPLRCDASCSVAMDGA